MRRLFVLMLAALSRCRCRRRPSTEWISIHRRPARGLRSCSCTVGLATAPRGRGRCRRSRRIIASSRSTCRGTAAVIPRRTASSRWMCSLAPSRRCAPKPMRSASFSSVTAWARPSFASTRTLYPQRVAGLVAVDGPLDLRAFGGELPPGFPPPLTGPEGRAAREGMIRSMFIPETPAPLQQQILSMMLAAPEATAVGAMNADVRPGDSLDRRHRTRRLSRSTRAPRPSRTLPLRRSSTRTTRPCRWRARATS